MPGPGTGVAGAALDDDWLDIPGYQPEYGWKPATGTGTAPDIHPPALRQEQERYMADDQRLTWGFILDVFDVLDRHGYRRSDSEHTGQAIGLIRHLARDYEGTLDAPVRGSVVAPSSPPTAPQPPGPPGQDAVLVSADQVTDPAGRAGRRRRIQAGPGRDVRPLRLTPAPPASGDCRPPIPTTRRPAA